MMINWTSNDYETVIIRCGRDFRNQPARQHYGNRNISSDLPESGGGASVGSTDGTDSKSSDDDDGGGGDDDPDPDRRNSSKKAHPSFAPALFNFAFLSHYIGFGRSRIYALIAQGNFPPPIKVGKSSRWVRQEIDKWLAAQIAARPQIQTGEHHG